MFSSRVRRTTNAGAQATLAAPSSPTSLVTIHETPSEHISDVRAEQKSLSLLENVVVDTSHTTAVAASSSPPPLRAPTQAKQALAAKQEPSPARKPQPTHQHHAAAPLQPVRPLQHRSRPRNNATTEALTSALTSLDGHERNLPATPRIPSNFEIAESSTPSALATRHASQPFRKFNTSRSWIPIANILPRKAIPVFAMIPHSINIRSMLLPVIMSLIALIPQFGIVATVMALVAPAVAPVLGVAQRQIPGMSNPLVWLIMSLCVRFNVHHMLAYILLPVFASHAWIITATMITAAVLISTYIRIFYLARFEPVNTATAFICELPQAATSLVVAPLALIVLRDNHALARAVIVLSAYAIPLLFYSAQLSLYRMSHLFGIAPDHFIHSAHLVPAVDAHESYEAGVKRILDSNMTRDEFVDFACASVDLAGLRQVSDEIGRSGQRRVMDMVEETKVLFMQDVGRVVNKAMNRYSGLGENLEWMAMHEYPIVVSDFVTQANPKAAPCASLVPFYGDVIDVLKRDFLGFAFLRMLRRITGADLAKALRPGGVYIMFQQHERLLRARLSPNVPSDGQRVVPCTHTDVFNGAILEPIPVGIMTSTLKMVGPSIADVLPLFRRVCAAMVIYACDDFSLGDVKAAVARCAGGVGV